MAVFYICVLPTFHDNFLMRAFETVSLNNIGSLLVLPTLVIEHSKY
jgi:hypothetical protein